MENTNINWNELSDNAVLEQIGRFVQQSRLKQNKSQQQIADAAGVNRSTLSQIENGKGGTLISLIQILRVLGQMSFVKVFQVEDRPSPMYLATLEMKKRKRARSTKGTKPYELPDW
ncbi:MAG TPA: helix-turn-helix transcriptional regulator [Prolixibacteraceae bacterium]|jgi:transcriptional regulator with XRE-family HTH domain|nr:helix-turn-helix transcriptional regulator [Prolixibacteraceae bacterium]HPR86088.1 helix-turn-helix transcriptional regulator [Prolixibacteraceae bacterium]